MIKHTPSGTSSTRAFVKRRTDVPPDFFPAEARGLAALRSACGLRVPNVYAVDARHIELEDLGTGARAPDYWERAGAGLAAQHAATAPTFGFAERGFCGDTPQDNTPDSDGWKFFGERRLLPQLARARDRGLVGRSDVIGVEGVIATLRNRIPALPPALLHGDLWLGNLHACADGGPALIDAGAVHYGWAEAELAMLCLFGTPSPPFFDAYAERATLRRDWRARAPVYNLYHLLNHVNLFGGGYLGKLRDAIAACR